MRWSSIRLRRILIWNISRCIRTSYFSLKRCAGKVKRAKTGADGRSRHPEIPWRTIIATRNRLIRSHLGIDNDTLRSVIRDDLPELPPQLKVLKKEAQS
ncbi:MAG: HepT-like ribonuclease domain-containing protein [Syntrophobacteraceae bacterium]|nr:DUF86 domain-containing protein [Desulfobacteraceae bacterium]